MSEVNFQGSAPELVKKQQVRQLVASVQDNLAQEQAYLESFDSAKSELSERCQQAARNDFDEVVRLTYQDTYTLARRLMSNDHDANDVVQEAYLRAWRFLPKFRREAEFSTWMYRIIANSSATYKEKGYKHRYADYDEAPDAALAVSSGAEESAENSMLSRKLQAALSVLSPNMKEVVVLRDIYDLPHQQIAEELGISETAAKVRLHRARNKLREIITKSAEPK